MDHDSPATTRYNALARRRYFERATTQLKRTPAFRGFSRRLLFDLVERRGLHVVPSGGGERGLDEPPHTDGNPFIAIIVLEGTVIAKPSPGEGVGVPLRMGVHLRSDIALTGLAEGLHLDTAEGQRAIFIAIDANALADCPAAAWSLDLDEFPGWQENLKAIKDAQRLEFVWVSAPSSTNVPLEAAMHILGAAIARLEIAGEKPNTPVHLDIVGPKRQRLVWQDDHFKIDPSLGPFPKEVMTTNSIALVGNPDDPTVWPKGQNDRLVDRVVYLTEDMPTSLPEEFRPLLPQSLLVPNKKESIYSSSVAAVLVDRDLTARSDCGLPCGREFEARALPVGHPQEPTMRPYRDSCVLRVDVPRLQRAWESWIRDGADQRPPFIDVAARKKAICQETSERWARTVINRRVGVAISGGGASAYRVGPLLKRMKRAGIPIDVLAALSGGALIGAFVCESGLPGFDYARYLAPFFQATLPGVVVWTWPVEATLDIFLGGARVEELETRFAAVAVALPDDTPPETTVVVKGTLGEAVRVSGCLPTSFAPTTKNATRYTDGGAGSLVPAHAAHCCGADVVLGCNVIPGPSRGNPLSVLGPVVALYRWTPLFGRLIDSYVWNAFLLSEASREAGDDAEVFVEFTPQSFPGIESTAFIAAPWIIDEAEREGDRLDEAVSKLKCEWGKLGHPRAKG